MELLILIVVVALVIAAVVLFMRAQSGPGGGGRAGGSAGLPTPGEDPARRTSVRGLRVGDVVNVEDHDCIVEQTLRFREGGFRWEEHLLVDGPFRRWLSVEDDEGLEVVLWQRGPEPGLEPGPKELAVDGTTYRFEERGTADYTLEKQGEAGTSGRAEYADYSAGEKRLGFERYGDAGDAWEVSRGTVISEHVLDIYPSSTGS